MSTPPARPKIYHITPIENLHSILTDSELVSDAVMIERGGPEAANGLPRIKQRRLTLPVDCHEELMVGDCVPFYFAPRSVMLFMIHKRNPEVTYRRGQEPMIHLEADFDAAVAWAEANGRRWAISLSNAGSYYAEFRARRRNLNEVNWAAVRATQWRGLQEEKQAEFLVHESFPWGLVERIGVCSVTYQRAVEEMIATAEHRPPVEVKPDWYY